MTVAHYSTGETVFVVIRPALPVIGTITPEPIYPIVGEVRSVWLLESLARENADQGDAVLEVPWETRPGVNAPQIRRLP